MGSHTGFNWLYHPLELLVRPENGGYNCNWKCKHGRIDVGVCVCEPRLKQCTAQLISLYCSQMWKTYPPPSRGKRFQSVILSLTSYRMTILANEAFLHFNQFSLRSISQTSHKKINIHSAAFQPGHLIRRRSPARRCSVFSVVSGAPLSHISIFKSA